MRPSPRQIPLLFVLACAPRPQQAPPPAAAEAPKAASPQADLSPYLVIPRELRYTLTGSFNKEPSTIQHAQTWALDSDGAHLLISTATEGGKSKPSTVERWVHDARGWGMVSSGPAGGAAEQFDPPQYALVAPLKPGATWSHSDVVGDSPLQQTCLVSESTAFCASGIAVTCRRTAPALDLITRSHYCPKVGFQGLEFSMVVAKFMVSEGRSSGLSIDGVSYPDPPESARPFPKLEEVVHP